MSELMIRLSDLEQVATYLPDIALREAVPVMAMIAALRADGDGGWCMGIDLASGPDEPIIMVEGPETAAAIEAQVPDARVEVRPEPEAEPDAPAEVPDPPAHGTAFSAREDLRIAEMRRAGKTFGQIAEALGRKISGVQFRWYKKLSGTSIDKLRKAADQDAPSPADRPSARHSTPYNSAEDLQLAELRRAGQSFAEIATAMGRTTSSIEGRWYGALRDAPIDRLRAAVRPPSAPIEATTSPRQRAVIQQLMLLDDNFEPEDDLMIVRSVVDCLSFDAIAADMDVGRGDIDARWDLLRRADEMVPASAAKPAEPYADLIRALQVLATGS